MNKLDSFTIEKVSEEAVFNLYAYLLDKYIPKKHECFKSIIEGLDNSLKNDNTLLWKEKDIKRFELIRKTVLAKSDLSDSIINNITYSRSGLTAFSFIKPNSEISVIFKGTGKGEWIDNGEGLSGIPQNNTYIYYDKTGNESGKLVLKKDYATDQQVEALNWFNKIAYENGWSELSGITVSGHSKGGNKAQFITINSDLPDCCISFNSQGFSPEAIGYFKKIHKDKFYERAGKILSFAADNDYISAIGNKIVSNDKHYFIKSKNSWHFLEGLLDENCHLRNFTYCGKISSFVKNVSDELMKMPPSVREYATLGVMNVFQKFLGEGNPVNGDSVSIEKTIAGLGVALYPILKQIR